MHDRKTKFMKAPNTKLAVKPPTPLFQKTLQRLPGPKAATSPKFPKRDNIFSKSRDTREDRGSRQMKMSRSSQTFSHGR